MHATSIELLNWLPYRGSHLLSLGPGAYGVLARAVGEPASSNWRGKSSLLAAVRFALYGWHPAQTEDEWITRGEGRGGVVLTLSDGLRVERSRIRGEATRLLVRSPDGIESARDPAQEVVERWVGLSHRDFLATSFFEQKRMSRFAVARPAERFADVAAWLRLGPLRRAEEDARKSLATLVDRESRLVAQVELLRRRAAEAGSETSLRERLAAALSAESGASRRVDELECLVEVERRSRAVSEARATRRAIERELRATGVPEARGRDEVALDGARVAASDAAREVRRLRVLARSEFDGRCPVAPIECPARAAINGRAAESRSLLHFAEAGERAAAERYAAAKRCDDEAIRAVQERAAAEARRAVLRRRLAEVDAQLRDAPGEGVAAGAEGAADRLRAARSELQSAATEVKLAGEALRRAEQGAKELAAAEAELRQVSAEAQTLREAVAILGRSGAQRRLARDAVGEIEAGANARLASAGIGLSVRLTWGRETGELAVACDDCGAAFPPGRSAKACRCGAERGPKVVDELGCELSNVSGAAEDLAGIALSLSAAAWVRADRSSGWGLALLDEPFGSLDEANRRALSGALGAMLSSAGGWEQALVVAHHEGVMDALPGRIQIVAGPHGSWPRVV